MSLSFLWVVLLRALQAALESAPTLLCGLLAAGVLRGMIGPAAIRGWFESDPRVGPVRAVLFGWLLPVCSFGVLPVAWELRRAGVARATVLAFLFAAPLANPISLAYGLQKLESQGQAGLGTLVFLLAGSFGVLVGMALLLNRWLPELAAEPSAAPEPPRSDLRRIGMAGLAAARGATGILLVFLLLGLIGSGLLALAPGGAMQRAINDRTVYAPLHMAGVAVPLATPPDQGMMFVSEMLFAKTSFGATFVFYLLGIGMNLGTFAWIAWVYGLRTLVRSAPVVVLGGILLGYALPFALPNLAPGAENSRRFLEIESDLGPETAWSRVVSQTLRTDQGEPHWFLVLSVAALGVIAAVGVISRRMGEGGTLAALGREPEESPEAAPKPVALLNRPLTGPQLALATLFVFLILAVAGLYVFYPEPSAVLAEIGNVQIELNQGLKKTPVNRNDLRRFAAQIERLQKKLALGELLRRGRTDPKLRQAAEELRVALDQFRAGLEENRPAAELEERYTAVRKAVARCREAVGGKAA